ncbi:MAG: helix-turn-helix transcriptional regulator [Candidatus Acidiferrales bacterium]
MVSTHSPATAAVPLYQEFSASPKFAAHIECFWVHRADEPVRDYRVLPDGCSDIIFEQPARDYGGLALVGTMTRAQAFNIPARHFTFGVRFRPGMAARLVRVPGSLAVDQSIPLADAWKSSAVRELLDQLAESDSPGGSVARFEAALGDPAPLDPIEKSLAWLAAAHGQVPVDALASAASLSPRQFRRLCLERTGLSPKRLARVLRFRHAAAHAGARRHGWADIALECGYYDQAHLINDFRELSGVSPAQFSALATSPLSPIAAAR